MGSIGAETDDAAGRLDRQKRNQMGKTQTRAIGVPWSSKRPFEAVEWDGSDDR